MIMTILTIANLSRFIKYLSYSQALVAWSYMFVWALWLFGAIKERLIFLRVAMVSVVFLGITDLLELVIRVSFHIPEIKWHQWATPLVWAVLFVLFNIEYTTLITEATKTSKRPGEGS